MFSSRAGAKLDHALTEFNLDVKKLVCADLGCSTGGFTSCLLERGAAKVYAVDTGYGVLDYKLRKDPRVVVLERTNAMHVVLPEPVNFISVDVSWTPQKLILPHALELLTKGGNIVSLLKPHYESKNAHPTPDLVSKTVDRVVAELKDLNINVVKIIPSPILGEKGGNPEFLMWVRGIL